MVRVVPSALLRGIVSCLVCLFALDPLSAQTSRPRLLFVRGGPDTGGFLKGGSDEQLADLSNDSTAPSNHGWGRLALMLESDGFRVEQLIETNGPLPFESMNLNRYAAIVLGSNNRPYSEAAVDAVEAYVRDGGGLVAISDANFGTNWAAASDSDQPFLTRFGMIMNQDNTALVSIAHGSGDFVEPFHPILVGVDSFLGEGVTPVTVTNAPDVSVRVVARMVGNVRLNDSPNGGSFRPATTNDAALAVAEAGFGRVVGYFDRNTFFNENGAGTDLTEREHSTLALNLFRWVAQFSPGETSGGATGAGGTGGIGDTGGFGTGGAHTGGITGLGGSSSGGSGASTGEATGGSTTTGGGGSTGSSTGSASAGTPTASGGTAAGGSSAGHGTGSAGVTSGLTYLPWVIELTRPKPGRPLRLKSGRGVSVRGQVLVDLPRGDKSVQVQWAIVQGSRNSNVVHPSNAPAWMEVTKVRPVNRKSRVKFVVRRADPGPLLEAGRQVELWLRSSTNFGLASGPTNDIAVKLPR